MTVIGPLATGSLAPTDPRITYAGFAGIDINSDRARPVRPVSFSSGVEYAAPEARVMLRTASPTIVFRIINNGLMANTTIVNRIFSVLVNGDLYQDYTPPTSGAYDLTLDFGSVQVRKVELVFPHAAGYDLLGVTLDPIYATLPFLPKKKIVLAGDSITQGAFASAARQSWAFLLGQAENAEIINMGYTGGVASTLGNGSWANSMNPDVIVALLGHNDFEAQNALTTFKSAVDTLLTTWLSGTTAAIYMVTPVWSNVSKSIPISSYRTAIGEVVSAKGSSRVTLIDGLSLATGSTSFFPDGIHPNDSGSIAIASALAPLVN
ncbi:MAG: SGNH/GDSL hydrolase family protein [Agrobacterium cavarae]|uniref:SGNH/GDSL hydrolase family protein n=1 Tax=Agrobacterium cavarae TaxID=2528239 RepID=UPI0031B3AD3E